MIKRWPWAWFDWPVYVQSKKRASFEFLLPRPDADRQQENFVLAMDKNRTNVDGMHTAIETSSFGVIMRFGPPDEGQSHISRRNPPAPEDMPMEVGVQSPIAALLPFLRNEVLAKGYGKRANHLSMFCRNRDPNMIPLLRHQETVIVRLEAEHYGQCELDAFGYALAQEAGMEVRFPEKTCREAALGELTNCGLPTGGLKSFPSSVLQQYR